MELAFVSKSLRAICENEIQAEHKYGPAVAEILKHRLADLCAATSIDDIVVGRPRVLDGAEKHMIIDLCDGYKIVFCANHPNNPAQTTDQSYWSNVCRIKILRIEGDND